MVARILLSLVPLLPLLGFLIIALNVKKLTKGVAAFIACTAILSSFIISAIFLGTLIRANLAGHKISYTMEIFNWINTADFAVNFSFLLDPLSSLMITIITGVGFLIHVYSIGYMHDDEGSNRFFSYLNLFVFFMLLLVLGSNYLIMFIGWEGVGLCSYLLIGFWFKNQNYTSAANKAFIMNRIGDLGLIVGIVLLFMQFGTVDYEIVFAKANIFPVGTTGLTLITIFLFIGAMGKSAQIPLYTWLPDAMAGPTPVSALIHAATMVTAGIYMVARNNLLYSLAPIGMSLVLVVGLATALFAATIALTQNDIKKVLAYSTVSQLGLMFVALGVGAYSSGIFHMATHAFFKALLFLGAGSVIHALGGEQDIRKMGGLKKYLPVTYATFLIGVLAISGIPPFAGFFSKDEILAHAFEANPIAWALALLTSLLTVFYMFRLFFLTFFGNTRASEQTIHHIHESPKSMTIPLIVLAVLSVVGGFMGVPEALMGSNRLHKFLEPVFEPSAKFLETKPLEHTTEYALMGTVIILTVVMIVIAYVMYAKKNAVPVADSEVSGAQKLVYNKYYIDEIYNAVIVKPLYWISDKLEIFIERSGIDRLVNSFGNVVIGGSKVTRLLQSGNIGFYIFVMVISIIVLLAAKGFMY
jgi:NADH-quinone oxidoreductase subunit L